VEKYQKVLREGFLVESWILVVHRRRFLFQIVLAVVSFFTISLGGLGIGIVIGILTALVTKYTSHVRGMYSSGLAQEDKRGVIREER